MGGRGTRPLGGGGAEGAAANAPADDVTGRLSREHSRRRRLAQLSEQRLGRMMAARRAQAVGSVSAVPLPSSFFSCLSWVFFLFLLPPPCLFASLSPLAVPSAGEPVRLPILPLSLVLGIYLFIPSRLWRRCDPETRAGPLSRLPAQEQTGGELCSVGVLGETPVAAVTGHQEKLLRPKVRVESSQSKKKKNH